MQICCLDPLVWTRLHLQRLLGAPGPLCLLEEGQSSAEKQSFGRGQISWCFLPSAQVWSRRRTRTACLEKDSLEGAERGWKPYKVTLGKGSQHTCSIPASPGRIFRFGEKEEGRERKGIKKGGREDSQWSVCVGYHSFLVEYAPLKPLE